MANVGENFNERLEEIEAYLDLLEVLDREVKSGRPPTVGTTPITVQQQRILYSAVYLQLYNLVEATVTWCIDSITDAAASGARWVPADLSTGLRKEWIRLTAKTHLPLSEDNRLANAVAACESIIAARPVSWPKDPQRKSNWDDDDIASLSSRLGCSVTLSPSTYRGVKQPIRDDKGPLKLVKDLRNKLAHGGISFEECGTGVTVEDLRETKDRTVAYLREVVAAYTNHVEEYRFLEVARRPHQGGLA